MCGFVGFSSTCDNKEAIVDSMLKEIYHRGPDSQETYVDDDVALGFARLSIIDLEGGTQPLYNEDKSMVLVFNGEIYNFQTLREDLVAKGHTFSTQTDSEVLIHGYEEYGPELLPKLRGMFAFTIWDKKNKKIFGVRDHFGIKPYYYAQMNGAFIFGSEIKSFLPHPQFEKELNKECLPNYLTFGYVPGTDTFFKNVYMLNPGHYYEYQDGKLEIKRYFEPKFEPDENKSFDEFVDEISATIKDSVKAHQFADVEVGCFLSSGVDSSYVATELSRLQKVKTYTIGFADLRYSEVPNARILADEIGVENYERRVTAEEYFDTAGKIQYHLDEPLANPSANLLYFVSQRASEDMKVVLSGEGADEMYGGYNSYKLPFKHKGFQKLPKGLRKAMAAVAKKMPNFKGKGFFIRNGEDIEDSYIGIMKGFDAEERDSFLKEKYDMPLPQYYTKQFYDKVEGFDKVSKMQYLDINMWMLQEILLKADKMSMANSLELRVPLLDIEIFNQAKTLPGKFKANGENTKLAMRQAARREMNNVTASRTKMPFPLPLPEWLKEDHYYELVKGYFTNDIARELFNTDKIVQLLDDHRNGVPARLTKIWTIFSFLLWYEQFFTMRH